MKPLILSLILAIGLTTGLNVFAQEEDKPETPQTEATIALNCDTRVSGTSCPAKYSTTIGLFSDSNPKDQVNSATSSPGSK